MGIHDLGNKIICECGNKTINEAIYIFQQSSLPYRKARKEVTRCNKTCCNKALTRLFDMVYFGKIDKEEIVKLIG